MAAIPCNSATAKQATKQNSAIPYQGPLSPDPTASSTLLIKEKQPQRTVSTSPPKRPSSLRHHLAVTKKQRTPTRIMRSLPILSTRSLAVQDTAFTSAPRATATMAISHNSPQREPAHQPDHQSIARFHFLYFLSSWRGLPSKSLFIDILALGVSRYGFWAWERIGFVYFDMTSFKSTNYNYTLRPNAFLYMYGQKLNET